MENMTMTTKQIGEAIRKDMPTMAKLVRESFEAGYFFAEWDGITYAVALDGKIWCREYLGYQAYLIYGHTHSAKSSECLWAYRDSLKKEKG